MDKDQRNFTKGRMNKSVDERLLPVGEYIDAQNVRLGSTELSEVGAVENSKGNVKLTTLKYKGVALSGDAICIGALDDSSEETMYWFVHDPNHSYGGVVDMIVSFNTQTQQLTYHVITTALLNFNPTYLVNGVDKIDDLLFFTDDYNEPRKINVTRGYPEPNASHIDQIVELDISVIKPQPVEAPAIELLKEAENSNYIEDIFISFAYRYKYKDGEYSATSQFSSLAFDPTQFYIKDSTVLNGGMENEFNTVKVTYNTGVSNVIGIDILYKKSDSNAIYVARKIDKKNPILIPDDIEQALVFDNSDIYTILSESEILRLYDNVPRLAKAQTIMGRRLMYGNYLEGRDLIDENGLNTKINYTVERVSRRGSISSKKYDVSDTTPYQYDLSGTPVTMQNASILLDVAGKPPEFYRRGVTLTVSITFKSEGILTGTGVPFSGFDFLYNNPIGDEFTLSFNYSPPDDYQTAYQAYNQPSFKQSTGENGNYEPLPQFWSQDSTFTGLFNFLSPQITSIDPNINPDLVPIRSARSVVSPNTEPVLFEVQSDGNILITPNAIQYDGDAIGDNLYQFFNIVSASVAWRRSSGEKSLHSNRDYQVGIVYQDAEGRQTTAFESLDSSIHVKSFYSDSINRMKVTIPIDMKPPFWADRYKFVAKQSKTDYETIYSTRAYIDDETGRYWVFLDGEQANKLSDGQELIVKKDSNGPATETVKTTVLDVVSQPSDFLQNNIPSIDAIAGLYASVDPDGWSIDSQQNSVLTNNQWQIASGDFSGLTAADLYYPLYDLNDPAQGPWQIPAGSLVNININIIRRGTDDVCGDKICRFNEQYIASQDYPDFYQFWLIQGVNVAEFDCSETNDPSGANSNVFIPSLDPLPTPQFLPYNIPVTATGQTHLGENRIQFFQNTTSGNDELYLRVSQGSNACPPIECNTNARIEIITQEGLLIFETEPTETPNNIYFENEQSFPIVNGFHTSGNIEDDQDQTASQDGIVNLTFFNCFTFLNGAESYKIKDSILGSKFYLGQRVTSVSDEDYREIRRDASITYSGVYNEQTNINRTNEFNLGLANYKDCEISYGPIQVLHRRMTDLLTLQEDRISYISINKNLLTVADGGGVLTSVPEVLGTQVARIEEYGISSNPESFCHYGADIYFTDAKRSAVIQLKGGSQAESLSVISDAGMRSWFRDLFQTSFDHQKLGGYDPYMDEYVLSPNTNLIPSEPVVYGCGGASRVYTGLLSAQLLTIDAGLLYGNVTVFVVATHAVEITVTYNGVTTPPVSGTGSLNLYFDKDVPSVTTFEVTITPTDPNSLSSTEIFVGCPVADTIKIVPIAITSASDQGDLIHNAYGYSDATVTPTYQSPYQSSQVQFISPSQQQYVSANLVSQFGPTYTAQQGSGSSPIDGSTVQIISSKTFGDTFDFDTTTNGFRYLRTATEYQNNAADIATLLSSSTATSNLGSAPLFYGEFSMPSGNDDDFLYLIWDYRNNSELKLCYSTDVSEACCECFSSPSCVPFLGTTVELTDGAACALTPTTTYYTSTISVGGVTNTEPILGTTVYSYLGCSSGNVIGAGYIKLTDNTWVETDSTGVVINTGSC
jgi:hypothetical protein